MRRTLVTVTLILAVSCSRRQPVATRVPVPPAPPAPPASMVALDNATAEFARSGYPEATSTD